MQVIGSDSIMAIESNERDAKKKSPRIPLYLPDDLKKILTDEAKKRRVSRNSHIIELLWRQVYKEGGIKREDF